MTTSRYEGSRLWVGKMRHWKANLKFVALMILFCVNFHRFSAEERNQNWTSNGDSWSYWWAYSEGFNGPSNWGLLNLDWFMCDKGRKQSPINIETSSLTYDPHLGSLKLDNNLISGLLYNDGHSIVFNVSLNSRFLTQGNKAEDELQLIQAGGGSIVSRENNTTRGLSMQTSSLLTRRDVSSSLFNDQFLTSAASGENSIQFESTDANLLRDLSDSVELSINQNDRIESSGDSLALGQSEAANQLDNSIDTLVEPKSAQGGTGAESIVISGAGLAYEYKFELFYLRFGRDLMGSEHRINGRAYAAELQLLAYNSILYKSFDEAATKPSGLLAIAVLIEPLNVSQQQASKNNAPSQRDHSELDNLVDLIGANLKYRDSWLQVRALNLSALMPELHQLVAYEGSLTTPGCHESVDWMVLNRPLYISEASLLKLRSVSADERSQAPSGTLIAGNTRPPQPVNGRPIRTNIRPVASAARPEVCARLWTKYEYRREAAPAEAAAPQ